MKIGLHLQQVLKREIRERGLTVNRLARECRIPVSVLHGWLQGVLPSAKSLHHIATLSRRLSIPVAVLLFNWDEESNRAVVVVNSEFEDGDQKYRLLIEKVRKGEKA